MIERIFNFSSISTTTDVSSYVDPLSDYERLNALTFHVETGDYFPSLATLLGFVEETLAGADSAQESISIQLEAVRAARKDLHYLHDHCRIEPRS